MRHDQDAAVAAATVADDVHSALLEDLLGGVAGCFPRRETRQSCGQMVSGLLMELEDHNCWTIAEAVGHHGPHRLQHLLSRAVWDDRQVLDIASAWAAGHLDDGDAVLIVDETADEKSSAGAAGAARQYSGTVGGIALCQVAVTLTYATGRGHALIGRALYLPEACAADEEHRELAGIPEEVMFATKPQLAGALLERAHSRGIRAAFATGDEVYGGRELRLGIRQRGMGYVMAVRANHTVTTGSGRTMTAAAAATMIPGHAWHRMRTGSGTKGIRHYDWAVLEVTSDDTPDGHGGGHSVLLTRRHRYTGTLSFYRCWTPGPAVLSRLIAVAVSRWRIEEDHQLAKGSSINNPQVPWFPPGDVVGRVDMVDSGELLAAKFEVIFPHLDERQRRLLMGAEARALGHGGIRVVARAAGVREATVSQGAAELDRGEGPLGRVRRAGGGRKRLADLDPGLRPALLALVEPDERGDPMSPLRWTTKSLRVLSAELSRQGHRAGPDTVADLLHEEGFSLQGNAKAIEGNQVPDRDAQFRYLNEQVRDHCDAGEPVVSVDTKKKELVGQYRNGGREWRPAGAPVRVDVHDFPDQVLGKAIPYGIYDLAANTGWVNVGTDHDTAQFAVESIRRWWNDAGRAAHPDARRLLITADSGGSNSSRTRAWKTELAALALETGLEITACHFPPGTSKWNKIEHRLFSHITMNWRGRPLTSHEVITSTIASTTTRAGLRVRAELDTGTYPPGAKVSDEQMAALPLHRHDWHGDWNYTLHPRPPAPARAPIPRPGRGERPGWAHPALTGMTAARWDQLTAALALPYQAQREAGLHIARGGPASRRPAGGHPAALTLAEKTLVTIMRQRMGVPQPVLAELFGVSKGTIATTERQIKPLLERAGHTIEPATAQLATLADLTAYATSQGITLTPKTKPAR